MRNLHRLGAVVGLIFLNISTYVQARAPNGPDAELASCIQRSAEGRKWLERTLWGLRDKEGGWQGAEIANRDGSHDLGPMQVNSQWVSRLARLTARSAEEIRHRLIFDTCFNVDAARWLFLTALRTRHDYWAAVGLYHSPNRDRGRAYAVDMARRLAARFGPNIFQQSDPPSS